MMLAALVTLSPFAIDTYLAAMPTMATFFGVGMGVVELTITLYFLGFAIGNFFGGPLSDSFGRKPVALTGIALYGLSAFLIPFSGNIEMVLVLRVIQAFGGGFATVTANVFIRDRYSGKQVARLITIVSMMMMFAPLIAPVIGTLLLQFHGWRAIFFFLSAFALVLFFSFLVAIPESRDRSRINGKLSAEQLVGKYRLFFSHAPSVILLFSISFAMSGLYIFLTGASYIYIEFFQVSPGVFPIFFGANVMMNILLSLLNTFLLRKFDPGSILRAGLYLQLTAGIFLFVVVRAGAPSLWMVFSGIVMFIGSLGMIFGNGTAVILNHNPGVSGSANATIGITRFLLSFIIGSLIALFHTQNLVPIGTAMFVCTLAGNILYIFAMRRMKSAGHGID